MVNQECGSAIQVAAQNASSIPHPTVGVKGLLVASQAGRSTFAPTAPFAAAQDSGRLGRGKGPGRKDSQTREGANLDQSFSASSFNFLNTGGSNAE